MIAVLATLLTLAAAEAPTPALLGVEPAKALPVQFDGRVMPLDTYARRTVEAIGGDYGRPASSVSFVLSWVFEPGKWLDVPLIRVGSDTLGLVVETEGSAGLASYRQLAGNVELNRIVSRARSTLQQGK